MNHPKRQHYVPQFLLRRFADPPGSERLHVFDKASNRAFKAKTKRVGAENRFYDLDLGDETLSLEQGLGNFEGRAATVVRDIVAAEQIGFLDDTQRNDLATFVVLQHFRTKQFREGIVEMNRLMVEALERIDPTAPVRLGLEEPTEEEARAQALHHLAKSPELTPHILTKSWILYEAPGDHPFWVGDHPVAMNNTVNVDPLRGTIGLAVEGIEIYLPISPRFTIGFLCPSLRAMTEAAYQKSLEVQDLTGVQIPAHDGLGAASDGFILGFPVLGEPENIKYLNSLQVLSSERFLFSCSSDFTLAEEMLDANPEVSRGPRPQLG